MNVQRAIGVLNEAVGKHPTDGVPEGDPLREYKALEQMDSVLGVLDRAEVPGDSNDSDLDAQVEALIQARNDARARKDFAAADQIRDEISSLGVAIKDGPEGTTWSRAMETE